MEAAAPGRHGRRQGLASIFQLVRAGFGVTSSSQRPSTNPRAQPGPSPPALPASQPINRTRIRTA